ncbi:hypothetical protein NE237_024707 [Protea cynaroides]|uniref:Neprosin PEP catalytic domain-containing protein n=1 Tax=Protea cynaroides TaxID=273540 RepID=A0A9Q0H2R3_9MAGN|nr:hypothetical protein NE237_024707 [Protea cynaroides]
MRSIYIKSCLDCLACKILTTDQLADLFTQYALIEVLIPKLKAFGGKALISGNNLTAANDQYTMAQIWVEDGARGQLNILQTGWADKSSGNWWFITRDNIQVGYWPKELMTQLVNGVGIIKFGGFAVGTSEGPSPPMGNGNFPSDDYAKTAYFARVQYVEEDRTPRDLLDGMAEALADETGCYTINYYGYKNTNLGQFFTYGGPGGSYCGA